MTKDAKNLIVGLDIGTSKVVAVVAEVMSDGRHEVIGLGQHESKGLKKGVVVNIEATVESIQRALEEAGEILASMRLEKSNIPQNLKVKVNQRFRNYESDVDGAKRKLKTLQDDKSALFGKRYTDDPSRDDQLEQRQQLLSGTDRLERSSGRLRESQRLALETEDIGRNTLSDLAGQREVIEHTRGTLLESEGYTDRSNKTVRGMARRYLPNLC